MAKIRGGLGKGLNALIPDGKMQMEEKQPLKIDSHKIPIQDICPNREQPRKKFAREKIDALVASIKLHGVIQPIVVRPLEKGYEIVAGERRWRASREAGLKEIPCIIKEMNDRQGVEIALIENLQREDLNPMEEAMAYKRLMDAYKVTQEEISAAVGKSRPHITNTIRLLNLDEGIQEMVISEELTSGHARTLLRILDVEMRHEIAKRIIQNNLSVRETEELVSNLLEKKEKSIKPVKEKDRGLFFIEESLKTLLGTKVNIVKGKKKGKIEIEYYSDEELERIIEIINKK